MGHWATISAFVNYPAHRQNDGTIT